jgi:hypothetical protein
MTELSDKITLTLTSDRKLVSIETTNLRVRLNGLTNTDYKTMLGAAGIELRFEDSRDAAICTAATAMLQAKL